MLPDRLTHLSDPFCCFVFVFEFVFVFVFIGCYQQTGSFDPFTPCSLSLGCSISSSLMYNIIGQYLQPVILKEWWNLGLLSTCCQNTSWTPSWAPVFRLLLLSCLVDPPTFLGQPWNIQFKMQSLCIDCFVCVLMQLVHYPKAGTHTCTGNRSANIFRTSLFISKMSQMPEFLFENKAFITIGQLSSYLLWFLIR